MSIRQLDDFVAVPLPTELYLAMAKRYPNGVSSVIENVVWDFLERTEEDFTYSKGSANGIYWGSLFLPSETGLRVRYKGEYKYAEVIGDKIVSDGEEFPSISRLASAMCNNTSVNAWKIVEVKRPTDPTWVLADTKR